MIRRDLYPLFGHMLEYPSPTRRVDTSGLLERLDGEHAEAAQRLRGFVGQMSGMDLAQREELHSRTFDVLPSCDPYVSSQLFGPESYQRGPLMAGLTETYARAGLDCRPELPDHIGVVLRFAEPFERDVWEDLVRHCLWGAVQRMSSTLQSTGNPFGEFFGAVLKLFAADVPDVLTAPPDTPLRVLSPAFGEMEEVTHA
jgi:nitrate reductase delta subunit